MSKFILVDHFLGDVWESDAPDHESAAREIATPTNLAGCLSPKLVLSEHQNKNVKGSLTFVDEATKEGWGPGCKFEGQQPGMQLIVEVIER